MSLHASDLDGAKTSEKSVMTDQFSAVAIGRNEGARLQKCIESLSAANKIIYVDSGSTDNSREVAGGLNVEVINLDPSEPFTAARARNAGFARLIEVEPNIRYVQFIDGDCELIGGWTASATALLDRNPDVAAVCGRLSERHPEQSIYNWLCDQEWNGPTGEVRTFAGNVMVRASALQAMRGYREDLIAGEEGELALRLRAAKWLIWRLHDEMAKHDAAMTKFSQWWKRSLRTGHAFAQGADLHGASAERHFVWERRRALLWGVLLPICCVGSGLLFGRLGLVLFLVFPGQVVRLTTRGSGSLRDRALLAFFHVLSRFPESLGVMKFHLDRFLGRRARLIEHK